MVEREGMVEAEPLVRFDSKFCRKACKVGCVPGKPRGIPKTLVLESVELAPLVSIRFWKAVLSASRAGLAFLLLEPVI